MQDIDNIINVTDVASKGVVFDTPPVALAPNVMTNVRNVRFKSGAIRKMEGELLLSDLESTTTEYPVLNQTYPGFPELSDIISQGNIAGYHLGKVRYFAVWEEPSISPDQCYYITVRDFVNTSSGVIVGQRVFIQNAIKSTDPGYARRDITPSFNFTAISGTTGSTTVNQLQPKNGNTINALINGGNIQVGATISGFGIQPDTMVTKVTVISGTLTGIAFNKPLIDDIPSGDTITWGVYPGFTPVFSGWGHTLFGGGFAFILNNGVDRPHYIKIEPNALTGIDYGSPTIRDIELRELPGWDSYYGHGEIIKDTFSGDSALVPVFAIGQEVDFQLNSLLVKRIRAGTTVILKPEAGTPAGNFPSPAATTIPNQSNGYNIPENPSGSTGSTYHGLIPGVYPGDANLPSVTADHYQIYRNENTGITLLYLDLQADDEVEIQVRTRNVIRVSCGIIEAFGNLLVAGNLKTTDPTNANKTLRRQPGVVRVSDVAATDSFPTNWNPFAGSTSTADEFTLSETSSIKDMKSLQSNFYIYSTEGIHQLRLTGNSNLPVSFSSVTETYGAMTVKSVAEYDGRHFVVGKNDIYSFTGNPADIKSLCDGRTRSYFYDNLNPSYLDNLFVMANHRLNEIWINYPTIQSTVGNCDEALIYNYRDDTWTIRDLNEVVAGDIGPVVGGGIPEATIALSSNGQANDPLQSGNAGYTNIGNAQVQTTVFGTQPTPTALQHRWWTLKNFNALKITNKFVVLNSFVNQTISASQVQKFTWTADASTGGTGSPYRSSGVWTFDGVDYDKTLTWVVYQFPNAGVDWSRADAAIAITLAPNLTTLADILDDIVNKMNTQGSNYYSENILGGTSRWYDKYFAWREDNSIYIRRLPKVNADQTTDIVSTGPRTTIPATSTNAALNSPFDGSTNLTPHNGVFLYVGNNNVSNPPYLQYPHQNRLPASDLVGANFPVPTITEEVAGTTVANKPSIDNGWIRLAYNNTNTSGSGGYRIYVTFDGVITPATIIERVKHTINVRYRNTGDNRSFFEAIDDPNPPAGTTSLIIRQRVGGPITVPLSSSIPTTPANPYNQSGGLTQASFDLSWFMQGDVPNTYNNTIIPHESDDRFTNPTATNVKAYMYSGTDGSDGGTTDSITFNFPLGDSFTTTLTDRVYDPEGTGDALQLEEEPLIILERIRDQYNASFGGVGQPIKYFTPTIVTGSSPNPFSIAWARPPEDAAPNLDPITWSVTNGTSRVGYTYPVLASNNNSAVVLYGDSVANLVTTNTGASPAFAILTRATLKIINNGVSTTVLDKRYGEGPGRLVLEPLSGINGAGESPYGDTGVTTDSDYLDLFYKGQTSNSGSTYGNGFSVEFKNILLDVITALSAYPNLLVEPDDAVNPTNIVIKPLEFSSTSNYVESFEINETSEATRAPGETTFHTQNRDGQTVAGTASLIVDGSTVSSTLSNLRPWSSSAVNDLKKFPLFAQTEGVSNRLRVGDLGFDFAGTKYVSFFERDQLSITTTFNTETVNSMVLWADGFSQESITNNLLRATLHIRTRGTNASGTESLLTNTGTNDAKLITNSFVVATDYKVDARVQGRFINYRIDDAALDYTAANDREWHISGLQLETLRGGTR